MKLICRLEKVVETKTSKGYAYSYTLIPVKDPYDKYVKLVVSGDNATATMDNLELSIEQGDTAMIDFSPKQTQGKLEAMDANNKKEKNTPKGTSPFNDVRK